jgi:hypothetical protein
MTEGVGSFIYYNGLKTTLEYIYIYIYNCHCYYNTSIAEMYYYTNPCTTNRLLTHVLPHMHACSKLW